MSLTKSECYASENDMFIRWNKAEILKHGNGKLMRWSNFYKTKIMKERIFMKAKIVSAA